ncbi:MAG: hypothetical protein LBT46_09035 [Planctomycetaceae bacterium]|jgi:hypothetical protein|nr:hypothetical protein [Planctomycetaceae bacterium]
MSETKTVQEVIESVGIEKKDLDGKINRLNEFLANKEQSGHLSSEYYWAVVNQSRAMEIYSSMLKSRLELLKLNKHLEI